MMSRISLAWSIGLWALVTWGGRIAIVFDTGSDAADRWRIAIAVLTAVAAVLTLATDRVARPTVTTYALVSGVIWVRSSISVIGGGGTVPFQVVHAVLATVSVALAVVALVTVWRRR